MSEIVAFTAANFEEEVLKAEGLVLVNFHATWCTHSKRLASVLREVAELYAGRMKAGKLDVFSEQPVPQQHRIFHTPTGLFFRDGQEVARMSGASVREHLKDKLEDLFAA